MNPRKSRTSLKRTSIQTLEKTPEIKEKSHGVIPLKDHSAPINKHNFPITPRGDLNHSMSDDDFIDDLPLADLKIKNKMSSTANTSKLLADPQFSAIRPNVTGISRHPHLKRSLSFVNSESQPELSQNSSSQKNNFEYAILSDYFVMHVLRL